MTEFNFARKLWGDWKTDIAIAQKRTTVKMDGVYNEPSKPAVRPDADDHQKYPSLRGGTLYYQDGRVEKMKR